MAKTLALLLFGVALLAGCQQSATVTYRLPSPIFDAPAPAQVAVTPVPVKPVQPLPKAPAAPQSDASIPRTWIPSVAARPWKWIVVHHSATAVGGAVRFDREHREKGWDELGYHFVIGNGTDTRDGAVEVGSRWPRQKWGAHAKTPDNRFNDFGIGICLVGNFENGRPSAVQLDSLSRLIAYLMKTYNIPADRIVGHRDCKSTDCPGKYVSLPEVRKQASLRLAELNRPTPLRAATASGN